ncbi:MAG: tRNA (adenosine(37)-N6)-threonylcarbamoyltransferase complex ATPase subunit type 1 TsaE [Candidatus Omnitrophica bacterium]|nr:tRNA (adenosine(37)-N6)-threonylcarbamoyltransferase complex ATPase subunit type 1 TsaE [Candidatus Omnitrophota bacterium]
MKTYVTRCREGTIELGARLAKGFKGGDVIALTGELGSGKTTLTKGIAKGLGVKAYRYVNSPSFVIIKEYQGKAPLYHFDVFRVDSLSEVDALGFEEYFYGNGVCVVEWADKIRNLLPNKRIEIKIETIGIKERNVSVRRNESSRDRYLK